MIGTILLADLIWVAVMLPIQLAIALGPALWRRRANRAGRASAPLDWRPRWMREPETPQARYKTWMMRARTRRWEARRWAR